MATPILLLNAGSSSIKYQMIDADTEEVLASGLIERIGQDVGVLTHKVNGEEFVANEEYSNHSLALAAMVQMFADHGPSLDDVRAVGHRTVHGGDKLTRTMLIDESVVATLEALSPLAPLHNPPGIAGIRGAQKALPNVPHVAVFDTAFFSTLPPASYTYAIPTDVAERYHIRRYGFHGTSHSYVSHRAAELLGKPYEQTSQIVCHLGNGASISAIKDGVAIDTSMGLTPLEGLVMGTRSGDVDPGMIAYLHREAGMSTDAIDTLLNKASGMLGLVGASDMRDVEAAKDDGDERAQLAWDVYIRRIVGYIGRYFVLLGGIDALSFTAGVGENSSSVRRDVVKGLAALGVTLDPVANTLRSKEARAISTKDSAFAVLVVPTNEELQMAREVKAVIA
ncbi:acetate kinase [Propioniciclava coleopterorum]|uniref:Acetate kinase n=1 Tax=Propioniciclava coleopterorum TaxID=2714937 RepID=A0A6G7Y6E8_9ACTN|nr:acetate kinase [Propioniciclava coleopterorum]QIK72385.1 acetate kinase [Propioniciclava coleopterorum]